jgi:hypothetical protein
MEKYSVQRVDPEHSRLLTANEDLCTTQIVNEPSNENAKVNRALLDVKVNIPLSNVVGLHKSSASQVSSTMPYTNESTVVEVFVDNKLITAQYDTGSVVTLIANKFMQAGFDCSNSGHVVLGDKFGSRVTASLVNVPCRLKNSNSPFVQDTDA